VGKYHPRIIYILFKFLLSRGCKTDCFRVVCHTLYDHTDDIYSSEHLIMVKTTVRHSEAPQEDYLLLGYTGGIFSLHIC